MKTLTVKNVPDSVYERLKGWAADNRRSLQEQVLYLLEQEVTTNRISVLEAASRYRERLRSRDLGSVAQDIREDRQR